jgi:hypothetical protein
VKNRFEGVARMTGVCHIPACCLHNAATMCVRPALMSTHSYKRVCPVRCFVWCQCPPQHPADGTNPHAQASLRPVLANLAFHYKLDLTVLRALQHLLALLSSWFNVTLGAHRFAMPTSSAQQPWADSVMH